MSLINYNDFTNNILINNQYRFPKWHISGKGTQYFLQLLGIISSQWYSVLGEERLFNYWELQSIAEIVLQHKMHDTSFAQCVPFPTWSLSINAVIKNNLLLFYVLLAYIWLHDFKLVTRQLFCFKHLHIIQVNPDCAVQWL